MGLVDTDGPGRAGAGARTVGVAGVSQYAGGKARVGARIHKRGRDSRRRTRHHPFGFLLEGALRRRSFHPRPPTAPGRKRLHDYWGVAAIVPVYGPADFAAGAA